MTALEFLKSLHEVCHFQTREGVRLEKHPIVNCGDGYRIKR